MNIPYFLRITVSIFILLTISVGGFSQEENKSSRLYTSHRLFQANLIPQHTKSIDGKLINAVDEWIYSPVPTEPNRNDPFISFGLKTSRGPLFSYRYLRSDSSWSVWSLLPEFHESEPQDVFFISEQVFITEEILAIQLKHKGEYPREEELQVDLFYPGNEHATPVPQRADIQDDCSCALPEFVDRVGWGSPDGQDPSCPDIVYVPVTHMIVHHTVNSNSLTDWPSAVWSIWNFHVNTRGWCDLGYNWLIDPNGVLYEGRGGGDDVRGAHFCGNNGATMGVAFLGTFTDVSPTPAAITTLTELLAWKSCKSNISPLSNSFHASSNLVLPHISGHRQGCSTECPGDSLFTKMAGIRSQVEDLTTNCLLATSISPEEEKIFEAFPIPFGERLQVILPVPAYSGILAVLDTHGRVVWQSEGTLTESLLLSTSSWPSGVYLLRLSGNQAEETKKVIKY